MVLLLDVPRAVRPGGRVGEVPGGDGVANAVGDGVEGELAVGQHIPGLFAGRAGVGAQARHLGGPPIAVRCPHGRRLGGPETEEYIVTGFRRKHNLLRPKYFKGPR